MNPTIDYLGSQVIFASTQECHYSAMTLLDCQVFAIVNLRADGAKSIGMRLMVRSNSHDISQFVAASVA